LICARRVKSVNDILDFSLDSAFISGLAVSDTEKIIPGLDYPALNSNEPSFDSPDLGLGLDVVSDTDAFVVPWDDGFVSANPPDLATPQKSCQAEEDSQISDVLQARDAQVCLPKEAEGLGLPLDLGTEPWWRRFFPLTEPTTESDKKPPPSRHTSSISDPQNVPEISPDSFRELSEEFEREKKCPREFPIRCCSDYVLGYRFSYQTRAVYFIKFDDCAESTFRVRLRSNGPNN
jgi:hypothetical protein